MAGLEHVVQNSASGTSQTFSIGNFFTDAYNNGIVKAVGDHPKEAIATAAGAIVLTGAASFAASRIGGALASTAEDLEPLPAASEPAGVSGVQIASGAMESSGSAAALKTGLTGQAETSTGTAFSSEIRYGGTSQAQPTTFLERLSADAKISKAMAGDGAPSAHPFEMYHQANYRFVPARSLVSSIGTAEGPLLQRTEGQSRVIFNSDNSVGKILFNAGSSSAEKSDLMMQAGYASLIHTDELAAKAAGTVEGRSIGFISQPIEREATTEQMQENALAGAKAYVTMDEQGANKFTTYLTERFGPMTKESQDWGRHIMGDATSAQAGWGTTTRPVTEDLINSGIPITSENRAAAIDVSTLKMPPWSRAAVANEAEPAFVGRSAPELSPDEVGAVRLTGSPTGEKATFDNSTIQRVADLLSNKAGAKKAFQHWTDLSDTANDDTITRLFVRRLD